MCKYANVQIALWASVSLCVTLCDKKNCHRDTQSEKEKHGVRKDMRHETWDMSGDNICDLPFSFAHLHTCTFAHLHGYHPNGNLIFPIHLSSKRKRKITPTLLAFSWWRRLVFSFHHFLSSQKVTKKDLTKRTCSACGFAQTAFCLNGMGWFTLRGVGSCSVFRSQGVALC
jgi:hypothetical protein